MSATSPSMALSNVERLPPARPLVRYPKLPTNFTRYQNRSVATEKASTASGVQQIKHEIIVLERRKAICAAAQSLCPPRR